MEEALALQRASVQRQTGQAERGAFFVLAPPAALGAAPLGGTVAPPPPLGADCESLPSSAVDSLVEQAARRLKLDEGMLRAVIQQESAFRPCAISPKGAMGLMQLMPSTALQFGVPNPFNPADNVEAGATLLKQLLVR
jgi:soluble lytic murein transglycosylase-like protein